MGGRIVQTIDDGKSITQIAENEKGEQAVVTINYDYEGSGLYGRPDVTQQAAKEALDNVR
jgi:hypothetical protein